MLRKVSRNIAGTILFLLTFFAANQIQAKSLYSSNQEVLTKLNNFIAKNDTSKLFSTLKQMSDHFDEFNTAENLNLLLRVSKKENRLNSRSLKELFLLIRRFYPDETNRSKNFEYTLKTYNVLNQTKDYEGTMWILIDLGNVFYQEQDYQEAYKFFKRAEIAGAKANSYYGLGVVNMNLGLLKERIYSFDSALKYYLKSIYFRSIAGEKKTNSLIFIKIAYCNLKLGKPQLCMDFIHEAEHNFYVDYNMPHEAIEAPFAINYVYAEYFAARKEYDSSIVYIQKGIDYAVQNQMVYEELMANNFKAEYLISDKKYNKAVESLLKFLPFFKKNKIIMFERHIYDLLQKCYSEMKDYQKATFYAQKFVALNDSLKQFHSNDNLEMMRSVVSVYETNFKINSTKKNIQIEKVRNAIKENERNKYWYIAIISVFLVFLLFGLFLNTQKNKLKMVDLHNRLIEQNNKIKINSIELNRSNQLKNNLFSIISNDLSEPLNRLKADIQILKNSAKDKKVTETIESTLNETIHLFEGLLDWSKADQTQNIFNPTKVSLDLNINKVISFFINDIQSMEISVINKSIALSTFADQNILQTLLRNIMSNSIAALNVSSYPKLIEIETLVHNHYLIELLISDSGPGFPTEILNQFNQMDYEINAKRKGLGLSICKVLSKMSGWKIEIANESKFGGASISVFIPIYNQIETKGIDNELIVNTFIQNELAPLTTYKVYQTSEIRFFLKNLDPFSDPLINLWIEEIEKAVREGDEIYYTKLINQIIG